MENHIYIDSSGAIRSVGDVPHDLEQIGTVVRKRASSIVPLNRWHRLWFLVLRSCFGERGIVAEWTRSWDCVWLCTIYETGQQCINPSRRAVLQWERAQLEKLLE